MTKQQEIAPATLESLARLADALDTTLDELLLRAPAEWYEPPAEEHAVLESVPEADCYRLLGTEEVGRLALDTTDGPVVFPVTYAMVAGRPVFRTTPSSPLATVGGRPVAFEVDRVDHVRREGWSVLVTGSGRVTTVSGAPELREAGPTPWPGGRRDVYVIVEPRRVTGRRIVRTRG